MMLAAAGRPNVHAPPKTKKKAARRQTHRRGGGDVRSEQAAEVLTQSLGRVCPLHQNQTFDNNNFVFVLTAQPRSRKTGPRFACCPM